MVGVCHWSTAKYSNAKLNLRSNARTSLPAIYPTSIINGPAVSHGLKHPGWPAQEAKEQDLVLCSNQPTFAF